MQVECRLKEVLGEHGLDHHGVIQEIAADIGVNRHTIAKLYNNRTPSLSFTLLSRLCNWLAEHHVPSDQLPGALLGSGRAPLWSAVARQGGEVTIYLGEYQITQKEEILWRWIARRDATVAAKMVHQLSKDTQGGSSAPRLDFEYVPFRYSPVDHIVDTHILEEDIRRTRSLFNRIQRGTQVTSIIIGSQRVNYLLEFCVADLCGCRPFVLPTGEPSVPFFSVYRPTDQSTPSCFGGMENPFRSKDKNKPGLHYMNDKGQWATCPWIRNEQDAGVVITVRDHRSGSMVLAIFGLSGLATEAVGEQLVLKEDLFWPPAVRFKSKDVGVYICRLTYAPNGDSPSQGRIKAGSCEVISLGERTLERFLGR